MQVDTLKARIDQLGEYASLNIPLPNKRCLIKLLERYFKKYSRLFDSQYVTGYLVIRDKKIKMWSTSKHKTFFGDECIKWTPGSIEGWSYIEDIDKQLNKGM